MLQSCGFVWSGIYSGDKDGKYIMAIDELNQVIDSKQQIFIYQLSFMQIL